MMLVDGKRIFKSCSQKIILPLRPIYVHIYLHPATFIVTTMAKPFR